MVPSEIRTQELFAPRVELSAETDPLKAERLKATEMLDSMQPRFRVPSIRLATVGFATTVTVQAAPLLRFEVPQVSLTIMKSEELLSVGARQPVRVPNPELVKMISFFADALPTLTLAKSTVESAYEVRMGAEATPATSIPFVVVDWVRVAPRRFVQERERVVVWRPEAVGDAATWTTQLAPAARFVVPQVSDVILK
jgi:hypothetical protein